MTIIRKHLLKTFSHGIHQDTRALDAMRDVSVEYGVSSRSAEGSVRVRIGKTEVVAGVKLELAKPYPDTPNKGGIIVSVELLPLAHPKFEAGPPSIDAIELSRVTDRAIRECAYIDFEKLCVAEGEKVWNVIIDLYPINVDGHLFDACSLAAVAALKDAKFPELTEDGLVDYKNRSSKGLPLRKESPISCTVCKLGEHLFVDPLDQEYENIDARVTVATLDNGDLCSLQKGGDAPFSAEELVQAVELATKKSKEMRKQL